MINSKKLTKIWQQVPADYYQKGIEKNLLQRVWHTHKFNTFKKLVEQKSFSKILDVGCASGRMTSEIKKIFPKSIITGTDAYPAAIAYAKKKYPKINFIIADAHKLPFPSNSFDLVTCYETIEHLINPSKALKEIKRDLKKDGTAIVAMDSGVLLFVIIWWLWEKIYGRVWKGAHLHPLHHTQMERLIHAAEFKTASKHFSHLRMEVSFILRK